MCLLYKLCSYGYRPVNQLEIAATIVTIASNREKSKIDDCNARGEWGVVCNRLECGRVVR
jgi:hypothetical protein